MAEYTRINPSTMLCPTPVVLVSCGEKDHPENRNLVTVAWAGTVNSEPPMVSVSIRKSRHSHDLICETQEFVINLVDRKLAPIADWCGVRSGKKYNKFVETGLTPVRATQVKAPMIEESPVNLECKVTQVIPLGSHDLFLAEIVAVHVNGKLFHPKTDAINLQKADLVVYSHGHYYALGDQLGKFGFSVEKKQSLH